MRLVWASPRSLAATDGILIGFYSSWYWNVLLPRVRSPTRSRSLVVLPRGVSPFGHLRIKGCSAPPRSVSPPRCVLHRLLKPRHPPYALVSHQETYNHSHCGAVEIRNPNIEIRNNIQTIKPKCSNREVPFWIWRLEFWICFELRASNFVLPLLRNGINPAP